MLLVPGGLERDAGSLQLVHTIPLVITQAARTSADVPAW